MLEKLLNTKSTGLERASPLRIAVSNLPAVILKLKVSLLPGLKMYSSGIFLLLLNHILEVLN
jgi:hypothetical protein